MVKRRKYKAGEEYKKKVLLLLYNSLRLGYIKLKTDFFAKNDLRIMVWSMQSKAKSDQFGVVTS